MDFKIRNFTYKDTEAFIQVATSAFAEEWVVDGLTPDGFAHQTRQIFRWRMIPYKILTALMGIQWEAFVAEIDGHAVGGAMYIGRKGRISLTNLMVEPSYRRNGIGQALLVKRLERLSQRNVPFVVAQVLETNQASLENLRKQGFVEYHRKSSYLCSLPVLGTEEKKNGSALIGRALKSSDRVLYNKIEKTIMSPFVLHNLGSKAGYFPSFWQKLYMRYVGSHSWACAFDVDGVTVGFLAAEHTHPMTTVYIYPPVLSPENMHYFPEMFSWACRWMESLGFHSAKIEVSDHLHELVSYLQDSGWNKQHTWIYLVKWLDEKAKEKFLNE